MRLGLQLGLATQQGSIQTLSQQVQAILSGRAGFALDPSDTSTMFQDTAGTVAVTTAADPVARINSKWGSAAKNFQQPTAGQRPAWDGVAGLTLDGTDDHFWDFSDLAFFAGISDMMICAAIKPTNFSVQRLLYNIGSTSAGAGRVALILPTTGGVNLFSRRNIETGTNTNSAAGVLSAGVKSVLTQRIKFVGSPVANSREDGVQIANTDPFGVSAATGGNSNRITYGADLGPASYFLGSLGRSVWCAFDVTDAERLTIEAWVGETAL